MPYTIQHPADFPACQALLNDRLLYSLHHNYELKSLTLRLLGNSEKDMPATVRFDGVLAYDMDAHAPQDASPQVQDWQLLTGGERWTAFCRATREDTAQEDARALANPASEDTLAIVTRLRSGAMLTVLCRAITVTLQRFPCPCCGCLTYQVPAAEDCGFICPVCYWENDAFLTADDEPSDSNHGLTLQQARQNVRTLGACSERFRGLVRAPREDETPQS